MKHIITTRFTRGCSRTAAALLLAGALGTLAGCKGYWSGSTTPIKDTSAIEAFHEDAQEDVEAFQERQRAFPARDKPVAIPKNALWLGEARAAHFRRAPARSLVTALVTPRPVKFEIESAANPMVSPPTDAVILKDYLDSIAIQSDWHYRVENGVVIFADWDSRTITLAPLVGVTTAEIKPYVGGSEAIPAANNLAITTDPYEDITNLVDAIFGSHSAAAAPGAEHYTPDPNWVDVGTGAAPLVPALVDAGAGDQEGNRAPSFTVSRAANQLFVSARPNQVRAVVAAVDAYNQSVSRRVIFDLTVYDVELTKGDERNFNLTAFAGANNSIQWGLGSPGQVGIDSLSVSRQTTSAATASTRTTLHALTLNWFERHGTITNEQRRRFETLNNQTVTFLNNREIEYVKSLLTNVEEGGARTRDLDTGTHLLGDTFSLFATILDTDRVNVKMNINSRTEARRERVNLGGTGTTGDQANVFEIDNIDRVIPLSLANGETRILTYFNTDRETTASGRNKLLPIIGDSENDSGTRRQTVMVISADIVE